MDAQHISDWRDKLERLSVFIIPVFAIAIVINQLYRQHTYNLSVWKGGGMGMFAALDRPRGNRFVKIYITDSNNNKLPIMGFHEHVYRINVEPSEKNFNALFDTISDTKWYYSDLLIPTYIRNSDGTKQLADRIPKPTRKRNNNEIDIQSIEIISGQLFFDNDTKELRTEVLKEHKYAINS
jgi:hypothetical protein